MIPIQIGGERQGITVSITDPRPRTDRSEGWLDSVIEVRAGVWTGRYPGQFHEGDLVTFAEQLGPLSSTLRGEAILKSMDGYLDVTLSGDGLGHVTVSGQAWHQPRYGSHLDFSFLIDQTYLPGIAASLAELLAKLGTPGRP